MRILTTLLLVTLLAGCTPREPGAAPVEPSHLSRVTGLDAGSVQNVTRSFDPTILQDVTYFRAEAAPGVDLVEALSRDASGFEQVSSQTGDLPIALRYAGRIVPHWETFRFDRIFGRKHCQRTPVPGSRTIFVLVGKRALVAVVFANNDSGELVRVPVGTNCGRWLGREA